ncbi:glycerophosphodiester phosphodiesterase GDPD1, chloroplastic-like protein, partial [Tanacetum coccineum]
MQSSATQEYPSLIQTFFDIHTVGGVFLRDEDRRLYEEMLRLQAGRGKDVLDVPVPRCNHTFDVNELKRSNKQLQKHNDMITKAMSSNARMSQLFTQLQTHHETDSGSQSGAGRDDESGDDEDADKDEEDADKPSIPCSSSRLEDAALLVKKLQERYPVYLLTNGGTQIYVDVRRNSLEEAKKVVLEGGLDGMVSEVNGIFRNSSAVREIKESNLSLLAYGKLK